MTFLVCRLILTGWVLYNMWTGRVWALYLSVTMLTVALELQRYVIGQLLVKLQTLPRLVRDVLLTTSGNP